MTDKTRRCGSCTLCCKLLPQRELHKGANVRCAHQRHTGCNIYSRRPPSCRLWSCLWLTGQGTEDQRRPDLSHAVIDSMPDYITIRNDVTGDAQFMPVIQLWVDPRHRDAHRAPELRAYFARRAEFEGTAVLVRYDNSDGFVIFPPAVSPTGDWYENYDGISGEEHSPLDKMKAIPNSFQDAMQQLLPAQEESPR